MSKRRRLGIASALCASALVATGCVSEREGPVETPQQFLDRRTLASCGELSLAPGEEIPDEAFQCLEEAQEEGAELAVTRPTAEGDPVTEYYRVLPGGGWEAYIDASQDAFGGGWWYTDCPEAESIEDLAACEGTPL